MNLNITHDEVKTAVVDFLEALEDSEEIFTGPGFELFTDGQQLLFLEAYAVGYARGRKESEPK